MVLTLSRNQIIILRCQLHMAFNKRLQNILLFLIQYNLFKD